MPVFPCFDPTTGASGGSSGGGGGGGADLSSLSYELVDLTDPSWIKVDPQGLIQSVAINSGLTTFTYNTVSPFPASTVLPNSTAEQPRWYRRLNIGGTDIDTDAAYVYATKLSSVTPNANFDNMLYHGIAELPASTSQATVNGQGTHVRLTKAGASFSGAFTRTNLQIWNSQANQVDFYGYGQARPGLALGVAGWGRKNTGVIASQGFRGFPASNTYTAGQPIYEVFVLGSRYSTESSTSGDTVSMRIESRAIVYMVGGSRVMTRRPIKKCGRAYSQSRTATERKSSTWRRFVSRSLFRSPSSAS